MYKPFPLTKIIGLLLLAFVFFSACKKDKEENLAITKENVSGTYKLTEYKIKSGSQEADFLAFFDDCAKDDLYKLNTDFSFEYVDAGVECGNGGYEDTWELSGSIITLEGYEYTIQKLTSSQLVVTNTYEDNGATVTEKQTYTRQ